MFKGLTRDLTYQRQLGIKVTDLKSMGIAIVQQDPTDKLDEMVTNGLEEALIRSGWERVGDDSLVRPFPFDPASGHVGPSCLMTAAIGVFHVVARIRLEAKARPPDSVLTRISALGVEYNFVKCIRGSHT